MNLKTSLASGYRKIVAAGTVVLAAASHALATAPDYSPVSYDVATGVTFTPGNSVTPVIIGFVAFLGALFAFGIAKKLGGFVLRFLGR